MKRIAVAVVVMVTALGLVACGGSGSDESPQQKHLDELAETAPELQLEVERALALEAFSRGDTASARAALAKGCPDTPPDEALENLRDVALSIEGIESSDLSRARKREGVEAMLSEQLC